MMPITKTNVWKFSRVLWSRWPALGPVFLGEALCCGHICFKVSRLPFAVTRVQITKNKKQNTVHQNTSWPTSLSGLNTKPTHRCTLKSQYSRQVKVKMGQLGWGAGADLRVGLYTSGLTGWRINGEINKKFNKSVIMPRLWFSHTCNKS